MLALARRRRPPGRRDVRVHVDRRSPGRRAPTPCCSPSRGGCGAPRWAPTSTASSSATRPCSPTQPRRGESGAARHGPAAARRWSGRRPPTRRWRSSSTCWSGTARAAPAATNTRGFTLPQLASWWPTRRAPSCSRPPAARWATEAVDGPGAQRSRNGLTIPAFADAHADRSVAGSRPARLRRARTEAAADARHRAARPDRGAA